jgi:hypothetical protein
MVEENGLVEKIDFRPSQATRIRYLASLLDDHAQTNALKIADHALDPGRLSSMDSVLKIRTLDLAIEDIQYRYNTHQLTKEDYLKVFLSTLNERSKMGNPGSDLDKIPAPAPPEEGHRSGRLSSGLGVREKVSFFEIAYRGAYHSLVDPDNGFAEGLQIIFGETAVRAYSDGRIKLDHIDLIQIMSISPRDLFFRPFSYMFTTGLKEQLSPDGDEKLVYQISPGAGVSFENRWLGLYYGLAEINFGINGDYKDNTILGGGIRAGTIKKITDSWKMNLSVEKLFYPFRESFQESKASAIQTFRLSQSHSLNFALSWDEVLSHGLTEVKLNWNYYF